MGFVSIPLKRVDGEETDLIRVLHQRQNGDIGYLVNKEDAEKAEEVFEAMKDSMFPPFKASIIIDPAGAYTTAAAMVAKVEDALMSHKLGEVRGKTCAVLGTGAVGQIAAVLLAKMGCEVMIASLNLLH